ncbi:MAG: arginine--tRNA ligase [Acidobacteriota bacterium]
MLKTSLLASLRADFAAAIARRIESLYDLQHEPIVQTPPNRRLGDLACPSALHLARTLRRKPRDIATEIAAELTLPAGIARVSVEGAGYVNAFLDRADTVARLLDEPLFSPTERTPKVIVEHTNINPNKAAHIGHLRNAVLGDILVRSLRRLGYRVETQNYIDDTGVQLADVVVGFVDLRGMSHDEVAALPEPFDYTCWDLYSEVGRWYQRDEERLALRRTTLHELESGEGERAEMGRLVAERIVHRHLKTMARFGVGYDLITRESDILGLDFFRRAFEQLRDTGAIHLEESGKNEGCWVMPLAQSEEFAGLEDPDKVIVRSDGTVTYVGKDIAYQMWKFGLLGADFEYVYWRDEELWRTTHGGGVEDHPSFGAADRVINVIDARQSYLQKIVRAGLEALGHHEQAERSIHFAYEMVSLSRKTAELLGFVSREDGDSKSLEMSGRKGIGVKADDLLDRLEEQGRERVLERYPELDADEAARLGRQMATAALRFFMVKATTTRVIAFDFDEALQTEGETGPYLQYSFVREQNIRNKLAENGLPTQVELDVVRDLPAEAFAADDLWEIVLTAAQTPEAVERAVDSLELSIVARQAYDLAGAFHSAYNSHRVFGEDDDTLRHARMAVFQVFRKSLAELAEILGVPALEKM